jgi:hypothetical protein
MALITSTSRTEHAASHEETPATVTRAAINLVSKLADVSGPAKLTQAAGTGL